MPIMSLINFIKSIQNVQTTIDDFRAEKDEILLIDYDKNTLVKRKKAQFLGLEIPKGEICINHKNCFALLKATCPNCGSPEISKNGSYRTCIKTIFDEKLQFKVQKYRCTDCETNFSTPLDELKNGKKRFSKDLQELAVELKTNHLMSGEAVSETIKYMFKTKINPETIRNWAKEVKEFQKPPEESDIYHFDEQRIKLDGKVCWRYGILDSCGNVINEDIFEDRGLENVEEFLTNSLKDREVFALITDLDKKYPNAIKREASEDAEGCSSPKDLIKRLKKFLRKKQDLPQDYEIYHQQCIFHLFQNITRELKKEAGFSPFSRKKLTFEAEKFRGRLFNVFYKDDVGKAMDAFDKIWEKSGEYSEAKRKLLKNIRKNFDRLTLFMIEKA